MVIAISIFDTLAFLSSGSSGESHATFALTVTRTTISQKNVQTSTHTTLLGQKIMYNSTYTRDSPDSSSHNSRSLHKKECSYVNKEWKAKKYYRQK